MELQTNSVLRSWGPAVIAAMIAGISGVVIGAQRQAVTEADIANFKLQQSVQDQRISDIDSHGSRQVVSMEGRLKAVEDRNIEQDRRIGAIDAAMSALSGRFIIVEDRLAACQACHMGGGAKALQEHMQKQGSGK